MVAEHISLYTALSYPLTKYLLSIATVEGNLRTGTKSTLRKLLVSPEHSDALSLEIDSRTFALVTDLSTVDLLYGAVSSQRRRIESG